MSRAFIQSLPLSASPPSRNAARAAARISAQSSCSGRPAPRRYFMDMLVDTVREEIAECSEKAYTSIAASELQSMLMLTSGEALAEFVEQRGWRLDGKTVAFSKAEEEQPTQKLPSAQLIQETLSYAKELERIV